MRTTGEKGIRAISFDGGGSRAFSQLEILRNIMHRLRFDLNRGDPDRIMRPCEYFDIMGGSDTGGLLVIMFVKLGMSVEDASREFEKLHNLVYNNMLQTPANRAQQLRTCMEDLLKAKGLPLDLKLCRDERFRENNDCSGFVLGAHRSNITNKIKFRTYSVRTEQDPDITVVDAALTTCAHSPYFPPVIVDTPSSQGEYVGGSIGTNNPCKQVISEACDLFGGDTRVACLLSLGTGHPGITSLCPKNEGDDEEYLRVLQAMANDSEQTAESVNTQMGHLGIYFRLSVEQGLQTKENSTLAWIIAQTKSYLDHKDTSRKVDHAIERLKLRQGLVALNQLKYSGGVQPYFKGAPRVTNHFVMRRVPWDRMVNTLVQSPLEPSEQSVVVLSGMAGCGKSQLVLKFMGEFKSRFKKVYFVDGSSQESIQIDLINLMRSSEANCPTTFEDSLNLLCDPDNCEWLLVYDNVDDINLELVDLLPQCSHGFIIITTRNALLGPFASKEEFHIELDVMSENEAVQVIMSSARLRDLENKEPVLAIANELGCLPGALVQAGSYMLRSKCSPAGYLQRLRDHKTELMRRPTGDPQKYSAYAAFDLSYECLSATAQSLLLMLSFFHHVDFPMEAIHQAAEVQFRHDPFTLEERDTRFEESVQFLLNTFCTIDAGTPMFSIMTIDMVNDELQSYSLASVTSTPITALIRIHPLIHSWASSRVSTEKREVMKSAAVRLMASAAKERRLAVYMTSHINSLLSRDLGNTVSFNDRAIFGEVMRIARRTRNAQEIWENIYRAILDREQDNMQPEEYKPGIIDVMAYLANTYRGQIHHSKAEVLKEKVLECRRLHLGETHLDTLEAMMRLANTRRWQGRFTDAESLEKQVLESRKLQLGESHADTLHVMSNLAHTYYFQGRYSDSETLNKQVLDTKTLSLEPDHPEILQAKSNLAHTYTAQCRYSEAEALQTEVLKERMKALGEDHLDTAIAMKNVAFTYRVQRRYDEAMALQRRVLGARTKILGDGHADTLEAMKNLAATYRLQGRHAMNNAMRIDETVEIVGSSREIMERFKDLHAESEKLQRQVLMGKEVLLGKTHLDTIKAMFDLATTCSALGRLSEAEELHQKVYDMRKDQLGEVHHDTLQSLSALAYIRCTQGQYSEARLMQRRVLEGMDEKNMKWIRDMKRIGFR
ncbi:hypothetical protein CPB86DRAFT_725334 [Serendipita vermifera]|nr:hypothetical protein CPB86DRAFT_725334 [Serendipita vermifera]